MATATLAPEHPPDVPTHAWRRLQTRSRPPESQLKSADEDGDESISLTVVPFQIAYAVSIHKAQGLEYDSVKIVITDEVEELVTHNIFYTAITRARERLKIYWTPEVEEKVINRIRPRDISKDVELLKNYLTEKQQEESFDFWL